MFDFVFHRNSKMVGLIILGLLLISGNSPAPVSAALPPYDPPNLIDQTPLAPLTNPTAGTYNSRYLSGFGLDSDFTVFFEDRDSSSAISYVSTTSGPTGFPTTVSVTNITDTHFLIKDWPITIETTDYAYRAWGAVGNNPDHHFYVSNDLVNWTLVSTFTIPNDAGFTSARGSVYYGFHDVILINGTYYAWGESNGGETMFVRSATGADDWEAFDKVGGNLLADGPLATPADSVSPTPTGSFFPLANNAGYGKIYLPGDDSGIYLAINTVAKPDQAPATLEANFIEPTNWTWHDASTGRLTPAHALLYQTAAHDYREAWMVPASDPDSNWTIMYTADYDGTRGLGYTGTLCGPYFNCTFFPIVTN